MDNRPIGFFDSGLGGITVLEEAVHELPNEDFIYFGDTANAPYGDKTPEEVLSLSENAFQHLLREGCKAIVIACNTATGVAADLLRKRYAFPIIGVEPALKPASLLPGDGKVLVMATQVALQTDKFHHLMDRYGQDAILIPCPGLMECVEKEELSGKHLESLLDALFSSVGDIPVKAVVLGCTHYPFLREAIATHFPKDTPLLDGSLGTAKQLHRKLSEYHLISPNTSKGSIVFESSAGGKEIQMEKMLCLLQKMKGRDVCKHS